ncbi:EAL domain-containing protein [Rhodoferax sp. GW822-FHT02A01]|uniref:bifunctional diguanylate cyclase/phosphodiesterase n=1 Tax=Rhodoferax sp. GW822-FHT02A01 TaxID=3141537 RepID=UPI00315D6C31
MDSRADGVKASGFGPLKSALFFVVLAALGYLALWGEFSGMDFIIPQYLILHTVMEMAAIVVAMLGAGIVWNAYASERPGHLVLLGVLLFGTGLLDFAHMLSVPGMPYMITPAEVQKSITFWLAARTLPAIGLCITAVGSREPLKDARSRFAMAAGVLLFVGLVYWAALFHMEWVPSFYVPLQGLTVYKVGYEYVLVAMYGFAALWMLRRLLREYRRTLAHLFVASAIAAISELCFTLYRSHGDLFNLVGHFYKIVCYVFIFRAVFASSVRQPFESLHAALDNEKRLAEQNRSVVRTLDLLEEAVLELDGQCRLINSNAGWRAIAGDDAVRDTHLLTHVHPDDRSGFELQFNALVTGVKDEVHGRFRFGSAERTDKWFECRFVAERNAFSGTTSVRGVMHDITKVYLQERHIHHMALHDALTGLPNRVLLEDRIQQAIQHANRSARRIAVCFVDLDHFKDINDAYGHKVGDELLLAIAHRLRDCLREGDTLARWGGDEFVALLHNLSEPGSERQVAQKMIAVAREPLEIAGIAVSSAFSMGIAVYPDDEPSGDIDALLAQADRAMFYAKSQGRNNFQFYSEVAGKGTGKKDLYVQAKLARAIHAGTITAWFQPLVNARSVLEGQPRMEGVEVLARWHDEELGWVAPGSFITMAENLGLIGDLSTQVRRTGFAALREWQQELPDLKMSINISKRQLFSVDFISDLLADVQTYGLQPRDIQLEITESVALADVTYADERLRSLAAAGFSLSIDDFGTGYASLSQLHDLPIGELKIDISFVRRLHTEDGYRMVQGILGLAKALRLSTVAEGVEDADTARLLGEMGVDLLQGYFFARPCSREDFVALPLFAGVH